MNDTPRPPQAARPEAERDALVTVGPDWRPSRIDFITPSLATPAQPEAPIDMVLYCPVCGLQHIDAPDHKHYMPGTAKEWDNPPHRSHLCHDCGHIWRPADVPTNGAERLKTRGKNDTPGAAVPSAAASQPEAEREEKWTGCAACSMGGWCGRRSCPNIAAKAQPAAQESKDDREPHPEELGKFYATIDEYCDRCGHRPAKFDVWLLARGLMNTSGRRRKPEARQPITKEWAMNMARLEESADADFDVWTAQPETQELPDTAPVWAALSEYDACADREAAKYANAFEQAVRAYARAAIAQEQARHKAERLAHTSLSQFQECGGDDIAEPVERLRFFCSLAMSGKDWLDVEPLFDGVTAAIAQDRERGTWVSVEERLPVKLPGREFSADVLVVSDSGYVGTSNLHWFKGHPPAWKGAPPTHWMPLPEAPGAALKADSQGGAK